MAHNGALTGLLHQQRDTPTRIDEITDRLITAIAIGEYLPGARLPVERDLAASLGAGRMTVRAALARFSIAGSSRHDVAAAAGPTSVTSGRTRPLTRSDARCGLASASYATAATRYAACRAPSAGRPQSAARTTTYRSSGPGSTNTDPRRAGWPPSRPTAGFIWRSWTPRTTTFSSRCCSTRRRP